MSTQDAESIQREMAQIRYGLYRNVEGIVESAREIADWRHYVRLYPWASVAAAAAVGFFLVPARRTMLQPDAKTIAALIRRGELKIEPQPTTRSSSMLGSVFSGLAGTALRGALGIVGQQLAGYVDARLKARTMSAFEHR